MKRNNLTVFFSVMVVLFTGMGCNKDSVSSGPPAIVMAQKPTIISVSPDSDTANAVVTITGTNFKTTTTDDTVKFNGVSTAVNSATATQLVVNAPASGSTGNITVTTSAGTSNGKTYTYTVASTGPDVYVAGQDGLYATYWKNGKEVFLSDGTQTARAVAICISGTDIYVAGYDGYRATYWKNGTPVSLNDGGFNSRATGIAIAGGNVYVSGFQNSSFGADHPLAEYWNNGVPVKFVPDSNYISQANGIVYYGGTVYITGSVSGRDNIYTNTGFIYAVPGAGKINYFTADSVYSVGNAICSSPTGAIFVGGVVLNGTDPAPQAWNNSFPYFSTSGFTSYCYGIAVDSSNEIYAVGVSLQPGKKTIATLWKGLGQAYNLNDGTQNAGAYGVVAHHGDVYVVGYEYTSATTSVPKYWKNGVGIEMSATDVNAGGFAIAVQ